MSITFAEALQRIVNTFLFENCNTVVPAIVEKQDGNFRIQCTPALNRKYPDGTVLEYKPIVNVPLIYPRTRQAIFRLPKLQKGDSVLIVFSQKALDSWLSSSDGGKVTPDDPRRFDITDAIAIPGLYPFQVEDPVPESDENLEIKFGDSFFVLKPDGACSIEAGGCTFEMSSNKVSINGSNLTVDV